MSLAVFIAFLEAHGTFILGILLVIEQWIASNPKLKANSYLQIFLNALKAVLGKFSAKK